MDVFCPLKRVETPLRILYSHGFRKRRRREDTVREELRTPVLRYPFEVKSRFHTLDNPPSRSLFEEFALSYDRLCPRAFQYRDFDHDCDPGRDRDEGNKRKASENGPDRASNFLLDL